MRFHLPFFFQLVFIVENADAEMDSGNEATIIVDRISVDYDSCDDHAATHEVQGNVTKKRTKHSKTRQVRGQVLKN